MDVYIHVHTQKIHSMREWEREWGVRFYMLSIILGKREPAWAGLVLA